MQLVSGPLLK